MTAGAAPDQVDLRSYLAILRRRRTTVVVVTAITVALALALSLAQRREYQASAEILLNSTSPQQLFDPVTGQLSDPTRVELEHRGWENVAEEPAAKRDDYDTGWGYVLGVYENTLR